MSALADAAWAEAAIELDLDVRRRGRDVRSRRTATIDDELVGTVDGHRVRIRSPQALEVIEVFSIDVAFARPLLLGAHIQFGRAAPDSLLSRATTYQGLDEGRVASLVLDTASGADLLDEVRESGMNVELDDRRVQLRAMEHPEGPGSVVRLVRLGVRVARLAERARGELGLVPWEERLLASMRRAEADFHLAVDAARFRASGSVGSATVEVELVVTDRPQLAARLALGAASAARAAGERWLRCRTDAERRFPLKHLVGRAHRTGDPKFDERFILDRPSKDMVARLGEDVRQDLYALTLSADVSATSEHVLVRTHHADVDVHELAASLLRIDAALARRSDSPYR